MKNVLNQLIRAEKYGVDWLLRSTRATDNNGHEGYFINVSLTQHTKVGDDQIAVQRESLYKSFGMNAVTLVQDALKHIPQFLDKSLREGFLRETQDVGELSPWELRDTIILSAELRDWRITIDHRNSETYINGVLYKDVKLADGTRVTTDAIEYIDLVAGIAKTKSSVYKLTKGEPEHV